MSSKALGNQKVSRSKSTPRRRNYFKRNKARVNNKFRPYIPKNRSGSIPNAVGATTSVIKGSEIIYTVGAVSGDIQSIIPVNPRSMNRCIRLYNTARTFQQWRPLNLEVEWCPTCPTTATGVVQIGTLWSSSVPSADVPSTLQVSNGGAIGAVYTRFRSRIQLNGRLSQNWYYFNDLSEDSNPFCIAFKVNLANSGYFILHYTYQFNNPTTQFQNSSSQPEGVGDPFLNPDGTTVFLRQTLKLLDNTTEIDFSPFTKFIKDTQGGEALLRNGVNVLKKIANPGSLYDAVNQSTFFRLPL